MKVTQYVMGSNFPAGGCGMSEALASPGLIMPLDYQGMKAGLIIRTATA